MSLPAQNSPNVLFGGLEATAGLRVKHKPYPPFPQLQGNNPCGLICSKGSLYHQKLETVGPVHNRPSTNKFHHFVKNNKRKDM